MMTPKEWKHFALSLLTIGALALVTISLSYHDGFCLHVDCGSVWLASALFRKSSPGITWTKSEDFGECCVILIDVIQTHSQIKISL
jgi:hypothetical protein